MLHTHCRDGYAHRGTLTAAESVKGNLAKLGPLEVAIVVLVALIGIGLLSRLLG